MNCQAAAPRTAGLVRPLLDWYDANRRPLPWRQNPEPYAVWVSEIMAQQTRMETLLAYYGRFMSRFPTVDILAAAGEEEVLKVWEGLGYYTRARNLHKAAQKLAAEYGGRLPRTKEAWLALPGVGEYTAGAIMSIAYGEPSPAVDGNVLRIYARLENSEGDIHSPRMKQQAAAFTEALMPPGRAGSFTQALMELGALVCLPKEPACPACPVAAFCQARALGRQRELPKKFAKKQQQSLPKTVLLIRDPDGRLLMRRRTENLLGGLWEFYLLDTALTPAEAKQHLQARGFVVELTRDLGPARHVFTHQIWQMRGYDCSVGAAPSPDDYQWVPKGEVQNLALPTALRPYTRQICKD